MTADPGTSTVLRIRDLSIRFGNTAVAPTVVNRASLELRNGEIHGLVGESGSGKTLIARSILDLLPPGARIVDGSIVFKERELRDLPDGEIRALRGGEIGMVFQEPMMSLNPALKIGRQMAEAMRLHSSLDEAAIRSNSIDMLERVRMPDPAGCLARYPHEFSGGMRQRIMLASVLMVRPALLLADEPTTALDVLIQKEVLEIMLEVVRDLGTAVLLITHDLGLVAKYAQHVTVLEKGVVVERGTVREKLSRPEHPYTRQLLASLPRRTDESAGERVPLVRPIVEVRDLQVTFSKRSFLPWKTPTEVRAVDGVSFNIYPGETVAVVGESGSGKTTLGRAILRLVRKTGGKVIVDGRDTDELKGRAARALRRDMQIVFQDPYSSLDPRKRIGQIVGEGLRLIPELDNKERRARVEQILQEVGIDTGWLQRFPHELSGGQRQRIGIARAIITHPRLVVADEAVSALDLTVQAQVLKLLKKLQARFNFSYLFIAHDLGVVEQIADRILVMFRGQVVEIASRNDIFDHPRHPYTCSLLNAVAELGGDAEQGYHLVQKEFAAPPPPAGLIEDLRYRGIAQARAELFEIGDGHFAAFSTPAAA
jgi:peptide/nickel transport system ATP-binding protein